MRNTLILLLLIFISNAIYSQDLIVTNDGDSINCKITKVKQDNVYFTFIHKDEIRNTLLPTSDISFYQTNFYQTSEIPKNMVVGYKDYPKLRIAVNGGYSYLTAKISKNVPNDLKDYIKKLKSGYHFGCDITYYYSEICGVGGKCSVFKSSNSIDDIYVQDIDGSIRYGKMSDNLTSLFVGPTFSTRFLSNNKKNAFLLDVSMGYMRYSNNMVLIEKYKIIGHTVGLAIDAGYDISLTKNLSLGLQVSWIIGSLGAYTLSGYGMPYPQTIKLQAGEHESLSRLDFSVGLRYTL